MNISTIIAIAFMFASFAFLGVVLVSMNQPGVFRAEPRRTIERLDHAIYRYSPRESDVTSALRFLEFVASSDQDLSRVASDTRALLERRIALIDGWVERLDRFAGMDDDPAPLGYMRDLPAGETSLDVIARAQAWTAASPLPYEASFAFDTARDAYKAGLDPTPALAKARAVLARHALSLRSALDELGAIR